MPNTPLPQFPTHSGCTNLCSLREGIKSVGIPTRWADWSLTPTPETPAVMFIGQNPGKREDQQGINFVGPTGNLAKYAYVGFNHPSRGPIGTGIYQRASVYFANIARCGTWGEIEPTRKQYSTCSHYLLGDLDLILPTCSRLLLVMMGGPSVEHTYKLLTGSASKVKAATDRSGETIDYNGFPIQLFSTYHPAYVLRKNAMLSAVMDHLRLVVDSIDGLSAIPSRPNIIPISEMIRIARTNT